MRRWRGSGIVASRKKKSEKYESRDDKSRVNRYLNRTHAGEANLKYLRGLSLWW